MGSSIAGLLPKFPLILGASGRRFSVISVFLFISFFTSLAGCLVQTQSLNFLPVDVKSTIPITFN